MSAFPNPVLFPFYVAILSVVVAHVALSRAVGTLIGISRREKIATSNTSAFHDWSGLIKQRFLSLKKDCRIFVHPISDSAYAFDRREVKNMSSSFWFAVFIDIAAGNSIRRRYIFNGISQRFVGRYRHGEEPPGTLGDTSVSIKDAPDKVVNIPLWDKAFLSHVAELICQLGRAYRNGGFSFRVMKRMLRANVAFESCNMGAVLPCQAKHQRAFRWVAIRIQKAEPIGFYFGIYGIKKRFIDCVKSRA